MATATTTAEPARLYDPTEFPPIEFDRIMELVTARVYMTLPAMIAPDVAAAILAEFNVHNRPESAKLIEQYTRDIRAGKWVGKNSQTISFNVNCELDNGQNRLKACIAAGVAFPVTLSFGNAADAFDSIDRGKKRTTADTLSHQAEKHATTLGAALQVQIRYERGRVDSDRHATEAEVKASLSSHPKIRTAVDWFINHVRGKVSVGNAPASFALYQMILSDPERAAEFRDLWASGANLHATHPVLILRNHLWRRKAGDEDSPKSKLKLRGNTEQAYQAAVIIKAWNAFLTGQEIKALSWSPGEKFPRVR